MNEHIQQAADVTRRDLTTGLNKLAYDLALASHNYRFPNNTNERAAWEDSPELRAADVDAACTAWLSARNVQPLVTPEQRAVLPPVPAVR